MSAPDREDHGLEVSREADRGSRGTAPARQGATVLLTGLPAAGKSTLAVALQRRLADAGRPAYLLDGDTLRQGLSEDLGFSPRDRTEHLRRVAHVARLFADAGLVAVASVIAPLREHRAVMRRTHAEAGLPFLEVFVDTPLQECQRRDPKGLYAQARAGKLKDLTGVGAPYEPPERPEVHVRTGEIAVEPAVQLILEELERERAR